VPNDVRLELLPVVVPTDERLELLPEFTKLDDREEDPKELFLYKPELLPELLRGRLE